jgi:hypothetical protein
MSTYCQELRDETFNAYMLDCLNKFLQWLDGMANTRPKYYNIVMLENLRFVGKAVEKQTAWEEWRKKRSELNEQYRTNVQNYVKYIFEYQFPKFTEYLAKLQGAIRSGNFQELTKQSEFAFPTFEKMFKAAFAKVPSALPHFSSSPPVTAWPLA